MEPILALYSASDIEIETGAAEEEATGEWGTEVVSKPILEDASAKETPDSIGKVDKEEAVEIGKSGNGVTSGIIGLVLASL